VIHAERLTTCHGPGVCATVVVIIGSLSVEGFAVDPVAL